MTEPLAVVSTTVLADYGVFFVEDTEVSAPIPPFPPMDSWWAPLAIGAWFLSWHDFNLPRIAMESWAAPPPPLDGSWERSAEFSILLPSGAARLRSLNGDPADEVLHLPHAGVFTLRVATRGREELLAYAASGPELPIRDIEQWVMQFF